MLELSVINSIIFGALQPWQPENLNEQTFYDLLRNKHNLKSQTISDVNNSLKVLLRDHQELFASLGKVSAGNLPSLFFTSAFSIPFNQTTEFYSLIIDLSSLQFLHQIIEELNKTEDDLESYYIVTTALTQVKYIAANAANILKEQNNSESTITQNTDSPLAEVSIKQNCDFTLRRAKLKAAQIFFEIQERFKHHIQSVDTPEQFYRYTLNEPYQESTLAYTPEYFRWLIENLLSQEEININEAIQILNDVTKNQEGFNDIITALENVIVASFFNVPLEGLQIANLANSAKYIEQVKQDITEQLTQLPYGHRRFDKINEALEKLSSKQITGNANLTLIIRLQNWLNTQAEAYKGNLSSVFVTPDSNKSKTGQRKALQKSEKTSADKFKQQAQEALHHFSGYNTQHRKIMQDTDYNRLIEYTYYLIEHEQLPKQIKPIPQIDLSANHIRYTYYLMHKAFYTSNEIKSIWIDFLQKVFTQLSSQNWQTIKTKFSTKPPNYDHDLNAMR